MSRALFRRSEASPISSTEIVQLSNKRTKQTAELPFNSLSVGIRMDNGYWYSKFDISKPLINQVDGTQIKYTHYTITAPIYQFANNAIH